MQINSKFFLFLILGLVLSLNFLILTPKSLAQGPEKMEECNTRQECEALLKEYEDKIARYEKEISGTGQKSKTLKNQIAILKKEVEKLNLQIHQSNAVIKDLGIEIVDTKQSVDKTSIEIENSKKNLANILRAVYKEDQKSGLEILFAGDKLSDFFNYLSALEALNSKNQEILGNIETSKAFLENQEKILEEDKEDLEKIVKIQMLQKNENESTKKENDYLLKLTEKQYQTLLKEKEELKKQVAKIIARITQLTLAGLKVPQSPEELYQLARLVGQQTGARPSLVLGLIEVESALGINVGQCNCQGQPQCNHPEISYKQVMSTSQWTAFEQITKELELNPKTTPVSCSATGQWGGAMGPAQFMPNTWLNSSYKQRVESITGIRPANPWSANDSFLAAALYLADKGAKTQKLQDERGAVTAYLCGTNTMTSRCKAAGGVWYTNRVMTKAEWWQEQINQGL